MRSHEADEPLDCDRRALAAFRRYTYRPHLRLGVLKALGIDNDNTELWKHRGFGTSQLPGGDGFLGECNQKYWLLLRKEAQGFF